MEMTRNWVIVALLIWAVCVTLLLFRAYVSTDIANGGGEREIEGVVHVLKDGHQQEPASNIKNEALSKPAIMESPDGKKSVTNVNQTGDRKSRLDLYFNKLFHQETAYEKESYTMIMLTYKRVKVLPKLLSHYCKAKRLHKIVVIWNDVGSEVPRELHDLGNKCEVPLHFIQEKENKLTNRFKPRPEIETECK